MDGILFSFKLITGTQIYIIKYTHVLFEIIKYHTSQVIGAELRRNSQLTMFTIQLASMEGTDYAHSVLVQCLIFTQTE